jgi:uncharacterized damage-inducible protein DinB
MYGLDGFRMMAGYNRWANERLYAVCATIPDEERKRDRQAFFHSIHGTLNHLLLGDRAWLGRFTGRPASFRSLDQELFADFDDLRRERSRTDDAIEAFCRTLTEEQLAADIEYATQAGARFKHPLAPALLHMFNHETHHRGQLTTMLAQLGLDYGATDAIVYYRETGNG